MVNNQTLTKIKGTLVGLYKAFASVQASLLKSSSILKKYVLQYYFKI